MTLKVGSARHDENGKYTGGKVGDQLQKTSANDLTGEVSQQNFYVHSKGWNVLRPLSTTHAIEIARAMEIACNNKSIGYSQGCQRKTVDNITSITPINVDCSKLVRDCVYHATKIDVGNFNTANEVAVLQKSGLFMKAFPFKSLTSTPLYNGDVLVTKTKGHTVIVVSGNTRKDNYTYYPTYKGTSNSFVDALASVGEKNTSFNYRTKIAVANGIKDYKGSVTQNNQLLKLLRGGKLIKP